MRGAGSTMQRGGAIPNSGSRQETHYGLRIVRSVKQPQPETARFIGRVTEQFGPAFQPKKSEPDERFGGLGVTVTESRKVMAAIRTRRGGFDARHVFTVENDLNRRMTDLGFGDVVMTVDPERPLRMFGRHRDILGINFRRDNRLERERRAIDLYLADVYGITENDAQARTKPLKPHVAFGSLVRQCFDQFQWEHIQDDPMDFLESRDRFVTDFDYLMYRADPIDVPAYVALNGIRISVER
jgi:hypothetical protein